MAVAIAGAAVFSPHPGKDMVEGFTAVAVPAAPFPIFSTSSSACVQKKRRPDDGTPLWRSFNPEQKGMEMNALTMLVARRALVLKEVSINENGPLYVRIVGRKPGLFAWILNAMQIDTTTIFEVYQTRIHFEEGSLFGRIREVIPMKKICNLGTGYLKPLLCLFLSILFFCVGVIRISRIAALAFSGYYGAYGLVAVILIVFLALFFLFLYFFGKTMILYVFPASGLGARVFFKRSLIEGVQLTEDDEARITNIITYLIDHQN